MEITREEKETLNILIQQWKFNAFWSVPSSYYYSSRHWALWYLDKLATKGEEQR